MIVEAQATIMQYSVAQAGSSRSTLWRPQCAFVKVLYLPAPPAPLLRRLSFTCNPRSIEVIRLRAWTVESTLRKVLQEANRNLHKRLWTQLPHEQCWFKCELTIQVDELASKETDLLMLMHSLSCNECTQSQTLAAFSSLRISLVMGE